MKVVVLGGAGVMGGRAVEDLASSPGVDMITVADRDTGRAQALAESNPAGPAVLKVQEVDATDHASLVGVMRGHDVAASALGPFYLFESRLVAAALEAGTDYVSICDDWSATQDVFMRFDGPARDRGVAIVTGSGASPGLSDMGVRYLADRLDSAEKVDINVYVPMESREGEATIMHALFVYGTTVPVFQDGTTQMLAAGAESWPVEFPAVGQIKVYNVGHSEPVTIPRYLPGVRDINMMMGLGRGTGALVAAGRLGAYKSPRRRELLSRYYVRLTDSKSRPAEQLEGAIRLDVTGALEGRTVTLMGCGTCSMRDSTGLGLSVGTMLVGSDRLTHRGGVFAPEGCFDPETFLRMVDAKGVTVYSDLAMTNRLLD